MIKLGDQPFESWWRRAQVISIHDGDTMVVRVDLGYSMTSELKLRLTGVNSPELKTVTGPDALAYTVGWNQLHWGCGEGAYPFFVRYDGWDNYGGRFDGVLVCGKNHCLNNDLLTSGNAKVYK
jgi:hypothetical protein